MTTRKNKSPLPLPGSEMFVTANQGWRPARVLAALDDERLLEYRMPAGTSALRRVRLLRDAQPNQIYGHCWLWSASDLWELTYWPVSYCDVPLKWLRAIVAAGQFWHGNPQQSAPQRQPDVLLRQRELTRGPAPF